MYDPGELALVMAALIALSRLRHCPPKESNAIFDVVDQLQKFVAGLVDIRNQLMLQLFASAYQKSLLYKSNPDEVQRSRLERIAHWIAECLSKTNFQDDVCCLGAENYFELRRVYGHHKAFDRVYNPHKPPPNTLVSSASTTGDASGTTSGTL